MITHHVVHESFKNNISNNTHNIAQGGHPVFRGTNAPSRSPLIATLHMKAFIYGFKNCWNIII